MAKQLTASGESVRGNSTHVHHEVPGAAHFHQKGIAKRPLQQIRLCAQKIDLQGPG